MAEQGRSTPQPTNWMERGLTYRAGPMLKMTRSATAAVVVCCDRQRVRAGPRYRPDGLPVTAYTPWPPGPAAGSGLVPASASGRLGRMRRRPARTRPLTRPAWAAWPLTEPGRPAAGPALQAHRVSRPWPQEQKADDGTPGRERRRRRHAAGANIAWGKTRAYASRVR